jgi:hypothetical protein
MKAILQFSLPEEQYEYEAASNGSKYKLILYDLEQFLRNEIKYAEKNELQPARDKLWELMKEENLDLYD